MEERRTGTRYESGDLIDTRRAVNKSGELSEGAICRTGCPAVAAPTRRLSRSISLRHPSDGLFGRRDPHST
jgi:hypothetical protein